MKIIDKIISFLILYLTKLQEFNKYYVNYEFNKKYEKWKKEHSKYCEKAIINSYKNSFTMNMNFLYLNNYKTHNWEDFIKEIKSYNTQEIGKYVYIKNVKEYSYAEYYKFCEKVLEKHKKELI